MEYCDLNLQAYNYDKSNNDQDYIKLIVSCIKEGYYNFALNYEYSDLTKPAPKNTFKPVELSLIEQKLKEDSSLEQYLPKLDKIQQISRITVTMNETKYLPLLQEGNKQLQTYDLIAVKTNNEKIFNELCINYDNFDMIQIDVQERIPSFVLKRGHISEAIKKGLYFEITYSQIFSSQENKRVILQNFMRIHKATKGKNIIITSNTMNQMHHRSPYDLVSLFNVLEMKNDDTYASLKKNPLLCIQRSKYRKTFKGTVSQASQLDIDRFQQKRVQNLERINNKVQKIKEKLQQKQENNSNLLDSLQQRQKKIVNKQNQQNSEFETQVKKKTKLNEKKQEQSKQEETTNIEQNKEEQQQQSNIDVLDFAIDTNPNN